MGLFKVLVEEPSFAAQIFRNLLRKCYQNHLNKFILSLKSQKLINRMVLRTMNKRKIKTKLRFFIRGFVYIVSRHFDIFWKCTSLL